VVEPYALRVRLILYNRLFAWIFLLALAFPACCFSAVPNTQKSDISPTFTLQWGFVHFPPLIYLDKDGEYKGELKELMNSISLLSDIPYAPMLYPNIRAIFNLNQQKINFAIGAKSLVEQKDHFLISAFPVAKMQLRILWRTGTSPVSSVEGLTGKKLVLLKGYTYGGLRTKLEKIAASNMSVENHNLAISALTLQRGDYALVYKTASEYSMTAIAQTDFEHAVLGEVDLYFILDRNVAQAEHIMQRLEQAYLRYQETVDTKSNQLDIP
jgi:polar amino acid transport system substrate-binding protein